MNFPVISCDIYHSGPEDCFELYLKFSDILTARTVFYSPKHVAFDLDDQGNIRGVEIVGHSPKRAFREPAAKEGNNRSLPEDGARE